MPTDADSSEQITEEVTSWPGVEAGPGSRGEFAFTVGRREIGHLHGDRAAPLRLPQGGVARSCTSRAGSTTTPSSRASPATPRARIESEDDVRDVIAMMRLNYDRAQCAFMTPARSRRSNRLSPGLYASRARAAAVRALAAHALVPAVCATEGNILVYAPAGRTTRGAIRRGGWHLAALPQPPPRGHVRSPTGSRRRCSYTRPTGPSRPTRPTSAAHSRAGTCSTRLRGHPHPGSHRGRDGLPVGRRRAPVAVHRRHDLPQGRVGHRGAGVERPRRLPREPRADSRPRLRRARPLGGERPAGRSSPTPTPTTAVAQRRAILSACGAGLNH